MMHVRLLLWSLRHHRGRNVLNATILAVMASVVMVFTSVMVELVAFARSSQDRELTRLILMAKMVSSPSLPMSLYPMLEEIDGVQAVDRFRVIPGRHESGARYMVFAEDERGLERTNDLFPVEPAVVEAWKRERPMGAIVTDATARELKLEVGKVAEVPTVFGPLKIKVVGLSRGGSMSRRIAVHFDYTRELGDEPGMCAYRVYAKPDDFKRVAAAINERTKNSTTPVEAVTVASYLNSVAAKASMIPSVLGFLGLFLILTAGLTLANTTGISIRERRTETATMRVFGYRRGTLFRMMLSECVVVGLAGGIFAAVVTFLLFRGGVKLTANELVVLKPIEVDKVGIAAGLLASVIVPVAGALPSAIANLRLPVVNALRD